MGAANPPPQDEYRKKITAAVHEVGYDSMEAALRNFEHAVACSGFAANGLARNLGLPDALPHGWTPVRLRLEHPSASAE